MIVGGKNLAGLTKEQLAIFRRRKIGFVFQSYNLVQDLNVYENIILPVELDGKRVDHEFVQEIMNCFSWRKGGKHFRVRSLAGSSSGWRLRGH